MNYIKTLNWIDQEMKFDKWYKVKSKEQIQTIKDMMDASLLPDCIFNKDYSKFKKSEDDYKEYLLKPIQKLK